MAGPLLFKRKTKKSQKRLGRPSRDSKLKGLISLLNTLQKKVKCQKNLIPYFEDNSPVKQVHDAELFEKFHRLADKLLSDDDDLLENCHRLAEKFETLKIKKGTDNAGRSEKFNELADKPISDGEKLLKNSPKYINTFSTPKVIKDSQPKADEDYILMDTSCVSINGDEDESKEFLKACQRSAKKIAMPKILKVSQSMTDLITKPNSENESKSNLSKKINCINSKDNVHTDPMPLGENKANPVDINKNKHDVVQAAKLPEKMKVVTKQTEKNKIVYKPKEKTPEKVQVVPKPAVKKNVKPDIVPNPLAKLPIVPKPLENCPEKINIVTKQPEKKPEKIKIVYKPTEKTPEKVKEVPKPAEKKIVKPDIVPNPPEKPIEPLEKKSEKQEEVKPKIGLKDFRFSTAEKKQVGNYNSNLFNPGKLIEQPMPKPNRRNIILDGSNVAFAHGRNCFSSKGLEYCLQYFIQRGHYVKAVVPLFRRNAFQSTDPKILDKLHKNGVIVFTPCKNFYGQRLVSYDDRFVLQLAYEWNAAVVSNDNYRDLIDESPAIRMIVETRVLGYTWCDDIFILAKDPYGRHGPTLDEILHF